MRAVEREEARRDLRVRHAAHRAGMALAEEQRLRLAAARRRRLHQHGAAAVTEGDLERVRQPPLDARTHDESIDQHLDGVAGGARQRPVVGQVAQRAVDAHAHEAAAPQRLELLLVLALSVAHDRRIQKQPRLRRQRDQAIHDLLHGLRRDLPAALEADWMPDAREQQAQVVGDLGDRADGGPRAAPNPLLLDRDRRRQTVDGVAVGLLHLLEELPGVGGERLDVAPLPFRIERVEGEGRLARAGEPGDDDEPLARDVDVDVLEVVSARAADDDAARHGARYGRPAPRANTCTSRHLRPRPPRPGAAPAGGPWCSRLHAIRAHIHC